MQLRHHPGSHHRAGRSRHPSTMNTAHAFNHTHTHTNARAHTWFFSQPIFQRYSRLGWSTKVNFLELPCSTCSSSLFSTTSVCTVRHSPTLPLNSWYSADSKAQRQLRSTSSSSLTVRRTRLSTVGDRAFPVAAARTCNSLPQRVTSAPSMSVFRRRLKAFPFRRSFPWTCYLNFCSACAVTVVIFGHLHVNRSFYFISLRTGLDVVPVTQPTASKHQKMMAFVTATCMLPCWAKNTCMFSAADVQQHC